MNDKLEKAIRNAMDQMTALNTAIEKIAAMDKTAGDKTFTQAIEYLQEQERERNRKTA